MGSLLSSVNYIHALKHWANVAATSVPELECTFVPYRCAAGMLALNVGLVHSPTALMFRNRVGYVPLFGGTFCALAKV